MNHHAHLIAHVAAALLSGRHDAEPHHVKAAVETAKAIVDQAHSVAGEPVDDPVVEPAPEPESEPEPDVQGAGEKTKP